MYQRNPEYSQAIFHAAAEIDRRCFFEIFGMTSDLCNLIPLHENLRNHLIVENKIIAVVFKKYVF
jgi:hypothetical protein